MHEGTIDLTFDPMQAHVYCEDGEHWDAMLNQTNLKNNNNKFYILQLLEDNSSSRYNVWFRWGRGKCVWPHPQNHGNIRMYLLLAEL